MLVGVEHGPLMEPSMQIGKVVGTAEVVSEGAVVEFRGKGDAVAPVPETEHGPVMEPKMQIGPRTPVS